LDFVPNLIIMGFPRLRLLFSRIVRGMLDELRTPLGV
jgi:hypothetical protein